MTLIYTGRQYDAERPQGGKANESNSSTQVGNMTLKRPQGGIADDSNSSTQVDTLIQKKDHV
jgi:hypothetical protein